MTNPKPVRSCTTSKAHSSASLVVFCEDSVREVKHIGNDLTAAYLDADHVIVGWKDVFIVRDL